MGYLSCDFGFAHGLFGAVWALYCDNLYSKRNSTCLILKNRLKVIDGASGYSQRTDKETLVCCGELIMARRRNLESAQPRPRTINNHISLLAYTQALVRVEIEDRNATLFGN